ncbi:MAG: AAA family ATPase [Bacteroidetes bacterium]|nr:AAA family ATPase [Bacteroidota bacterium]MCL2303395.1 AAA family ATPase [Lentimicrobiaceae bacterium]
MIKKIDYIKKFGCFQNYVWDSKGLSDFNKVNILYGYNGSGKTTLSNLFYLLSSNCKNKAELSDEYLLEDTSFKFVRENDSFSEKNYNEYSDFLYVFNSKFINDHIFDGSKSNMSSFGIESKITNEIIDEIDKKIKIATSRKKQLSSWDDQLTGKLTGLWNAQKMLFNQNISGKRLTDNPQRTESNNQNSTELKNELNILYLENKKCGNIESFKSIISLIKGKILELYTLDIKENELEKILQTCINSSATQELKSDIEKISSNTSENINQWLIIGNELLKTNKKFKDLHCPLCKSNIEKIIDNLIAQYDIYFNESLKKLFDDLNEFETQIKDVINHVEINIKILNDINVQLKQFKYELKNKIDFDNVLLKEQIRKLADLVLEKRKHPNENISLESILFSELKKINKSILLLTSELNEFVKKQEFEISKLLQRDIVNEIKAKVKNVTISEYNEMTNCILKNSKKNNSQIAKKIQGLVKILDIAIKNLNNEREEEVVKLEAETKFVNIYLEYLGISKFFVQKIKNKDAENIIISYTSGTKKHSLKYSLSEGEKTALAFAFFLSKIRAEQLEGSAKTFDKSTIVIDDPISSLDENRLFQTANLIDTFFHYNELVNDKIPKQTFILSHNINFLKYIANIFHANENIQDKICEYYIEPFAHSITKVPNGLKNFTTTYLEKLEEIIKYNENLSKVIYDDAKKYIPNYIRIVLESFLSFKLALVKEGSRERLPGLKFLIGKAFEKLKEYDENIKIGEVDRIGVIKKLNNLKRIADNESHGSISKIESLNYISETELKEFCKHTLQVIRYFDEIHYQKAKSLVSK